MEINNPNKGLSTSAEDISLITFLKMFIEDAKRASYMWIDENGEKRDVKNCDIEIAREDVLDSLDKERYLEITYTGKTSISFKECNGHCYEFFQV